jgi:hypothetical protein
MTKVGFFNMTLKPRGRVRNGTRYSLQDRRKIAYANKKSRQWSSFFSIPAVHKEFVPPGVTVNQKYYFEVLGRLRKRMMRVRVEIADD